MGKNILDEIVRRDDNNEMKESVKHGYLNTDSDFLKEDFRGGSCCVTALIRNGTLVVSNAGDCRAVMSRGGAAEALTSDHRPSREDERARIENLVSSKLSSSIKSCTYIMDHNEATFELRLMVLVNLSL